MTDVLLNTHQLLPLLELFQQLLHVALWTIVLALVAYPLVADGAKLDRPSPFNISKSKRYQLPQLSVVIPVRNEESNILTLLSSLWPQRELIHEVIIVDDHSTDRTLEMVNGFIATLPESATKFKILSAPEKEAHWVGKNWACSVGSAAAQGDHLLFLDADVELVPRSLEQLLLILQNKKPDIVTCVPWQRHPFALGRLLVGFYSVVELILPPHLRSLKSPYCVGQFICMRTESYQKIGGHSAISSSVAEDLDLMKNAKLSQMQDHCEIENRWYKVSMYQTFRDFLKGWSRLQQVGQSRSTPLQIIWAILVHVPLYSIFADESLYLVFYLFFLGLIGLRLRRMGDFSYASLLFYPLGVLLFDLVGLYAAYRNWRKKGIVWRNRSYSASGALS